ncbi:hypothetical protein ACWCPX_22340 [Streptomyces olivaceoviridis]
MWRHDPPGGRALVSCPGSLAIVDMPLLAQQLELSVPEPTEPADPDKDPYGIATVPLF